MKKLLSLSFVLLNYLMVHGQESAKRIDSALIYLDKSFVTSGVLLQNHLDSSLKIYDYNGSSQVVCSNSIWRNINYFMERGQFSGKIIHGNTSLVS
ncbi:MAG: hypothetical protein WC868_11375 [Bacteroidales bacterium]